MQIKKTTAADIEELMEIRLEMLREENCLKAQVVFLRKCDKYKPLFKHA